MKRPGSEIVLRALREGARVELDGYTYEMVDGRVYIIMFKESNGMREKVFVEPHMTLNDFISWCDRIPENDLFIIGATAVLNSNRRR